MSWALLIALLALAPWGLLAVIAVVWGWHAWHARTRRAAFWDQVNADIEARRCG